MRTPMTKRAFLRLSPRSRGYAVYMLGERTDEPNVPNEPCPYPRDSAQAKAWQQGQWNAYLDVLDGEE